MSRWINISANRWRFGSSCPLLKADEIDIAMDYDAVAKAGSMLGSGGMVLIDESCCMVDMARRIMHFYAHESCGWCIPCREGTSWLRKMLDRLHAGLGRPEDIDLIEELSKNMLGRTFCPSGGAPDAKAPRHLKSNEQLSRLFQLSRPRSLSCQSRNNQWDSAVSSR